MFNKIRKVFILPILFFALSIIVSGCLPTSENTEIVVSDGITSNGNLDDPEILPKATVYLIQNKDRKSLFKYLFADKVEGLNVQFYAKEFHEDQGSWRPLGDPLVTDGTGTVKMPGDPQLRSYFTDLSPPIDLQLRAMVLFQDNSSVFDDKGMIRILSNEPENNPQVVFTDHDNTLHATGGLNALLDWIDFLNWAKEDWPLVDDNVKEIIAALHDDGKDMVIVSGLPAPIRALCRDQVNLHFENSGMRFMPMVIKDDLEYEHGYEFKKGALEILKKLYGDENCIAMVGDTVREDGYGAISNNLSYIPFQISYHLNPSLLDTNGYGFVDSQKIAWDWSEVHSRIIGEDENNSNYFLKTIRRFLNIAHRGGGDLRPENTIPAYINSLSAGAHSLESDLHATKDGIVVVSHDKTVDRCTNGSGNVKDMELAELKELDAGYRYTPDGGTAYPYRGAGYTIPTLEEVFENSELDKAPMVVEIKQEEPSIIDDVLDLVEDHEMENKLILGSFNLDSLIQLREKAAQRNMNIVTSFAIEEVIEFFFMPMAVIMAGGYVPPGEVLQVPVEYMLGGINFTVISDEFMKKARFLGIKVQVWTINDPDEMRFLMNEMGVDGIMTDNPELLTDVVEERG